MAMTTKPAEMSSQVNPDLQKERDSKTFEVEQLTFLLDGGQNVTQRRRYIENLALQEDVFSNPLDYYFMSRDERFSDTIKRSAHYIRKIKELGLTDPQETAIYRSIAFPNMATPLVLHVGMFTHAVSTQASEEQKAKWMPLIASYDIIGTYAQTELGHGSHVRGLETTATYDPKTEEFVIHSPTQTSLKWWPGALGKTANYTVTMAQLHTNGQNYGMHPFMVPIRDMKTHEPLPGISVGDIGPKFGFDAMDNGYLKFDHVRIPREDMFMRNSEVLKDGTYVSRAENTKLAYGTMVWTRAKIVGGTGAALAQACTIATRYSAVRRQSELQPGAPEPQIMEYQTQQYKIFPMIAAAYAFRFVGKRIEELYFTVSEEIMKGNATLLPEVHALSAGLKAFASYEMMKGVEQCRLACGGLGYSHASGLPKLYVNSVQNATWEGENSVLYKQTSRYLMKAYQQASTGQKLTGSVAYVSEKNFDKCVIGEDCGLETLVAAYKYRATRQVLHAGRKVDQLRNRGKQQYEAVNMSGIPLTKAAEAHCHLYTLQTFVNVVQRVQTSGPVRAVLKQLCTLYALYGIFENAGDFLHDGFMTSEQLSFIERKVLDLLAEIRPNAVSLVDAFDFRDHQLCSILGRYDGQVYNNVYEWAQRSPLNKNQVHDSYYKYIQPLKKSQL